MAMLSARQHSMRYLMLTENSAALAVAVLNGIKQMQQQFTQTQGDNLTRGTVASGGDEPDRF